MSLSLFYAFLIILVKALLRLHRYLSFSDSHLEWLLFCATLEKLGNSEVGNFWKRDSDTISFHVYEVCSEKNRHSKILNFAELEWPIVKFFLLLSWYTCHWITVKSTAVFIAYVVCSSRKTLKCRRFTS